jgi:hypothetical protein
VDEQFDECGPEDRRLLRPNRVRLEHVAYFRAVLKGNPEPVSLSQDDELPASFELGRCHRNVQEWVKFHSLYRAFPGWLYGVSPTRRRLSVMCHSVAQQIENGDLLDVTPFPELVRLVRTQLRFHRHVGSLAEYQDLNSDQYG